MKTTNTMKKRTAAALAILCALLYACPVFADAVPGTAVTAPQVYQRRSASYYIDLQVPVQVVPVYCFYSAYMQDYLWTVSEEEKAGLEQKYLEGTETYVYQGIAGYVEAVPADTSVPVYRFWNKVTTDHFYTVSEAEKKQVEEDFRTGKDNYQYEGIAFYTPAASAWPAYRFFDLAAFNHMYTSNEEVRNTLQADFLSGTGTFRYEGVAWYWYE